jgi:hypothetical protein
MKLHAGRLTRIDDLVYGRSTEATVVMAGLDPAIHEAGQQVKSYGGMRRHFIMDCRVKPGNDEREVSDARQAHLQILFNIDFDEAR